MSVSARNSFLNWHTEQLQNKTIFNMQKEIVEYCVSDVEILRRACEKFRQIFIENCCVCPFSEAVIKASACNIVFRGCI